MENLRQSIKDVDNVKQTSNYINETPSVQNNYTSAVDQAKSLIKRLTNDESIRY